MTSQVPSDQWNDAVIMNVFEAAVSSHRIRKPSKFHDESNTNQGEGEGEGEGVPGPWMSVSPEIGTPVVNAYVDSIHNYDNQEVNESVNKMAENQLGTLPNLSTSSWEQSSLGIDQALQEMLSAWYQSGYATGRYHTLLEIEKQRQQRDQNTNEDDGANAL